MANFKLIIYSCYSFIGQSWSRIILKYDKSIIISGHSLRQSSTRKSHRMGNAGTLFPHPQKLTSLVLLTPKHLTYLVLERPIWHLGHTTSSPPSVEWEWMQEVDKMHYAILGNQSLWEGFTSFTNQEILTHFKPFPQDKKMYPP